MYEIETGVPIPLSRNVPKYPLAYLKVGDCFRVDTLNQAHSVKSIAKSMQCQHPGLKIARRKEGDGYRIWRVA